MWGSDNIILRSHTHGTDFDIVSSGPLHSELCTLSKQIDPKSMCSIFTVTDDDTYKKDLLSIIYLGGYVIQLKKSKQTSFL